MSMFLVLTLKINEGLLFFRDQLTLLVQAESTNLLTFTAGLSKPFRRIEKYCNHLQELERHLEENHPDRGDTQRAVSVYKDIAVSKATYIFSKSK